MTEKKEEEEFDPFESELVPKHEILSAEERAELMKKLNVALKHFPRVYEDDPIMKHIGAKRGDIIRIIRKSSVAGEYFYYRVVV